MSFTTTAVDKSGKTTVKAPTPREALDIYLKFYRENYETVTVEDEKGQALNLDRLSCLCEAAED